MSFRWLKRTGSSMRHLQPLLRLKHLHYLATGANELVFAKSYLTRAEYPAQDRPDPAGRVLLRVTNRHRRMKTNLAQLDWAVVLYYIANSQRVSRAVRERTRQARGVKEV